MQTQNPTFYLNSNNGSSLLAFGSKEILRVDKSSSLDLIQEFINKHKSNYIFGFLSYDIKNEIEDLKSKNIENLFFPMAYFFVPSYVVKIEMNNLYYQCGTENEESNTFVQNFLNQEMIDYSYKINWKARTSKKEYFKNIHAIKEHIKNGDVYELNYCQEFYAENIHLETPNNFYSKLNDSTLAPFSSFLTFDEFMVFSATPERFIKKVGNKLFSEPIKGTAPRGGDKKKDDQIIKELQDSPKERSENVMIVDLVRNDLSKIASSSSVKVDELCKLHSFKTVHQLISKISCDLKKETSFTDIIKATFPMGSMTGAPKISSMKIIEEMEQFKRGLYSGSIGYIEPNGDFDFNVVIRSILYNSQRKYLSCSVGGAITIESEAQKEYDECQTKVGKLMQLFNA